MSRFPEGSQSSGRSQFAGAGKVATSRPAARSITTTAPSVPVAASNRPPEWTLGLLCWMSHLRLLPELMVRYAKPECRRSSWSLVRSAM